MLSITRHTSTIMGITLFTWTGYLGPWRFPSRLLRTKPSGGSHLDSSPAQASPYGKVSIWLGLMSAHVCVNLRSVIERDERRIENSYTPSPSVLLP